MSLLLAVIRRPRVVRGYEVSDWNRLLSEVRSLRIGARIGYLLEDQGLVDCCPRRVREEWLSARHFPEFRQAQVRLELHKIRKALAPVETPVALLKGAAYAAADLPLARGRNFADLDLLVPADHIRDVEAALRDGGWQTQTLNAYDQRYYRRWMHEIPPMRHPERGVEVDVHHRILPLTSRLQPDPQLLWADSVAVPRTPYRVLSPADMLLHSATHLFYDGEIKGGFGNLLDIHEMLCDFARWDETFLTRLPERAVQLDLGRPLYYALVFSRMLLASPVPDSLLQRCRPLGPNPFSDWLMRRLVPPVLGPRYPRRRPAALRAQLLYMRSHWLRMPPVLLASHLMRKAVRRAGSHSESAAAQDAAGRAPR